MIGQTIGQYRILEKLGQGSMGVVYKAEHTLLKHLVVLKFLRPELIKDETRRARFLREAEIAASLDSPAICSVIDYGEEHTDDDRFYLVMRYCEGVTLREKLETGRLDFDRAVLFAIQLAEGVQTAHAHSVVHRDIKPSNIIIGTYRDESGSTLTEATVDGEATVDMPVVFEQAKITDFGLAFMPESTKLTASNAQLGTPAYMSPEQVASRPTDFRTDIWALGAVLYEMVTGVPPFGAGSAQAVMYAVEHSDPKPVAERAPGVPPELVWIIEKALRKNPDKRYQHVSDMLKDLRLLRQKLTTGRKREVGSWVLESRGRMLIFGGGLLAVAAALMGWNFFSGETVPSAAMLGRPHQVTADKAWEGEPAISPDGSRIAYVSNADGNLNIYVTTVRGGDALQLTDYNADDTGPAWHPDGDQVYFTSSRNDWFEIWKVGALGGDPVLVVSEAEDAAISPDGDRIAFCRRGQDGMLRIFVAPLDRTELARQLTHEDDGTFAHREPVWSPDGRTICYATYDDLWTVPADGGESHRLTTGGVYDRSPAWSPSGDMIYFSSMRENTNALWRVRVDGGRPERMTPGSGPEVHPSLSRDGTFLTYSTSTERANSDIEITSLTSGRAVTLPGLQKNYQPALRPDGGMICFVSNRTSASRDLWLQELADGVPRGAARRLTEQSGAAAQPQFSPDGRWVIYYRIEETERTVWTVSTGGGSSIPFTEAGGGNMSPVWSPDGTRIAFASNRDGTMAIYTAPISSGRRTGEAMRILPAGVHGNLPAWSPDGTEIAFVTILNEHENDVAIVAADGARPPRLLNLGASTHMVRWVRSTGELMVSGMWKNELALRRVDPATGESAELPTPFRFPESTPFAYFDVDANGELMTCTVSDHRGDIWLMETEEGTF